MSKLLKKLDKWAYTSAQVGGSAGPQGLKTLSAVHSISGDEKTNTTLTHNNL